jgi:hypothetical protein
MLRARRLVVLLSLVVLGASPAPVSGAVESAADAVTHSASSGTTKLSLNSDQGHQIQVGGTNVAVVDSSGMAVTGTFTYSAKPYVVGNQLSADLSLSSTAWTDLVWSSNIVSNGAMSWSSNKIFTPTTSGLYKVTLSVSARLEVGATAGERSVGLRLTDSSDNFLRATYSHIGYYDSAVDTMTAVTLGPLVVSLTGSTGYKFSSFSGNTGDGLLLSASSTFIVEAFP